MGCTTHWVAESLRIDVFKSNREVNQVQVDIAKAPGVVLGLCHLDGMLLAVVIIPQLSGNEDVLAFDNAFIDGSLDTLASFLLVLVVVCAVEEAITDFDGLICVSIES